MTEVHRQAGDYVQQVSYQDSMTLSSSPRPITRIGAPSQGVMTELNLPHIVESGFALVPVQAETPQIRFTGNGDSEAVGPLARYLRQLHTEMLGKHCTTVSIDLRELYFMNSSCLKNFVSWIYKVDTEGKPYEITLMANPRLQWQQRSFATLQRLAPTIVKVAVAA